MLIPVKFLAANYPYWNVVVSGFGFPALMIVLKKASMSFLMANFQGKAERGELSLDTIMSMYAKVSKLVSVSLTLANVIVMYLSKTVTSCVLSAVLSILTEVVCKIYVVWMTQAIVQEQFLQKTTMGLKQVVVEPGVQMVEEDEENINWRGRARAAEQRVSVLASKSNDMERDYKLKIRVLKELLRQTKLKYGEVVELEEVKKRSARRRWALKSRGTPAKRRRARTGARRTGSSF